MKVTDRRMFTDDGELREEYRFLEQGKGADGAAQPPPAGDRGGQAAPSEPASGPGGAAAIGAEPSAAASGPGGPAASGPAPSAPAGAPAASGAGEPPPGAAGSPGFVDLIAALAEPIAFLLGDAQLPDGRSAQDLPRARLHIDLLAVLQEKTRGNVSDQETALLEDLLAQLRMRYVEKSRG